MTATAANQIGVYVVTAQIAGVGSSATFTLTNLVGAPATVVVVSGGAASATVTTPFAEPLVVLVRDAAGNPVPDATVHFAAPSGQPTAHRQRVRCADRCHRPRPDAADRRNQGGKL